LLTDDAAVALAVSAADEQADPADEYELHRVVWSEDDQSWWVHFVTAVPRPGGHVTVIVDGQSGACRVVPGK
jgi:hypothetical protein